MTTVTLLQSPTMSIEFHIDARAGSARAARLLTPHQEIETPVFMPVGTAATVKAMPQDVLEELGVQILLGNTYHLFLRPGVETVRQFGGLHGFMALSLIHIFPSPIGFEFGICRRKTVPG